MSNLLLGCRCIQLSIFITSLAQALLSTRLPLPWVCTLLRLFALFTASVYLGLVCLAAMMWNGMHLLLSPAASHSGWEDNIQSDQFHYLHHRFFECNYGTSGSSWNLIKGCCVVVVVAAAAAVVVFRKFFQAAFLFAGVPWDRWFGTFRDKLHGKSATYRGEALVVGKASARELDAKATLLGLPTLDSLAYSICYISIFYIFYAALNGLHGVNEWVRNSGIFSALNWRHLRIVACFRISWESEALAL